MAGEKCEKCGCQIMDPFSGTVKIHDTDKCCGRGIPVPDTADYDLADASLLKIQEAYRELKAQGWADAIYCPKDGSVFLSIEAGSVGVHDTVYVGDWPDGSWFIQAGGDLWPSRPILWKPK